MYYVKLGQAVNAGIGGGIVDGRVLAYKMKLYSEVDMVDVVAGFADAKSINVCPVKECSHATYCREINGREDVVQSRHDVAACRSGAKLSVTLLY